MRRSVFYFSLFFILIGFLKMPAQQNDFYIATYIQSSEDTLYTRYNQDLYNQIEAANINALVQRAWDGTEDVLSPFYIEASNTDRKEDYIYTYAAAYYTRWKLRAQLYLIIHRDSNMKLVMAMWKIAGE